MREIYCVEKETKITRRSETQKRNLSVKVFRVRPTVANWLITTRYICEKGKNKKGARDLLPLLVFFCFFFRSIRRSQRWCHSLSHSLSLLGSPSFFCFSLSEFQLNGSWIAGHSWTWFISTGESDAIPENKTQKRKSFLLHHPPALLLACQMPLALCPRQIYSDKRIRNTFPRKIRETGTFAVKFLPSQMSL